MPIISIRDPPATRVSIAERWAGATPPAGSVSAWQVSVESWHVPGIPRTEQAPEKLTVESAVSVAASTARAHATWSAPRSRPDWPAKILRGLNRRCLRRFFAAGDASWA